MSAFKKNFIIETENRITPAGELGGPYAISDNILIFSPYILNARELYQNTLVAQPSNLFQESNSSGRLKVPFSKINYLLMEPILVPKGTERVTKKYVIKSKEEGNGVFFTAGGKANGNLVLANTHIETDDGRKILHSEIHEFPYEFKDTSFSPGDTIEETGFIKTTLFGTKGGEHPVHFLNPGAENGDKSLPKRLLNVVLSSSKYGSDVHIFPDPFLSKLYQGELQIRPVFNNGTEEELNAKLKELEKEGKIKLS